MLKDCARTRAQTDELQRHCQIKPVDMESRDPPRLLMTQINPFCYFKTSPEVICLAVMVYVRFRLILFSVKSAK